MPPPPPPQNFRYSFILTFNTRACLFVFVCVFELTIHALCVCVCVVEALHTISPISHPQPIHDSLHMTGETYSLYLERNWCHNHAWNIFNIQTHTYAVRTHSQQSIKIKFPSSKPVRQCCCRCWRNSSIFLSFFIFYSWFFLEDTFFGRLSTNFIVYIVNEAQWEKWTEMKEQKIFGRHDTKAHKFDLEKELTQSVLFLLLHSRLPSFFIRVCLWKMPCMIRFLQNILEYYMHITHYWSHSVARLPHIHLPILSTTKLDKFMHLSFVEISANHLVITMYI